MDCVLLPDEAAQAAQPEKKQKEVLLIVDCEEEEFAPTDGKNSLHEKKYEEDKRDEDEEKEEDTPSDVEDEDEDEDEFTASHVEDEEEEEYIPAYDSSDEEGVDEYIRQVNASEGYDVDDFPNLNMFGKVIQVYDCNSGSLAFKETLESMSASAIAHFNEQNGTNFHFVEVLKANAQVVRGASYYITFQANGDADETLIFQAKVVEFLDDEEVQLCRIKLSSPQ